MAKRNGFLAELNYAITDIRQKVVEEGWTGVKQTPQVINHMEGVDTSFPQQEETFMERFAREREEGWNKELYPAYAEAKEAHLAVKLPDKDDPLVGVIDRTQAKIDDINHLRREFNDSLDRERDAELEPEME